MLPDEEQMESRERVSVATRRTEIRREKGAAPVAQQFNAANFGPGPDPGDPGIESHIGLPDAWSLLLPLHVSLPLSVCLS